MSIRRKTLAAVFAAMIPLGGGGCQVTHELQPHRLWKWNHGSPGMPAEDWSHHAAPRGDSPACFASVADAPIGETGR